MSPDIFEFWSRMPRGANVHPADQPVFKRLDPQRHGFRLDCLPASFRGPLRTAPLVLLYLSPGFYKRDVDDANSAEGKDYYFRQWQGDEPIKENFTWSKSRTARFGDWEVLRHKVAILNIGAYHSEALKDRSVLASLPSSRMSIEWAQNYLFPEAEAGRRIVICLRAAAYWGLEKGRRYGSSLFAPEVTRSGFLIDGEAREQLISLVKSKI